MTKMNQFMEKYVADKGLVRFEELSKLFALELTEIYGCIVLRESINASSQIKSAEDIKRLYHDLTAFEASCNEIYVNHYFKDTPHTLNSLMEISFALVVTLFERLKRCYPNYAFQIVLSMDIEKTGDGVDDSATIRFTTKRMNESPYINAEEIEEFDQPILVFEIDQ